MIEMSSDDFHSDLARAERRRIIVAFAIAPFMYAAFGLLDFFVFPQLFDVLFRIRLTISCVYGLMFVTSMLARSYAATVAHGAIGILIGGAGVAAMTHVTGGYASPYYTGIMLVLVFGAVLFTWPWWVTAIVWCLVLLSYFLPIGLLDEAIHLPTLAMTSFFLVSTAIVCLAGNVLRMQLARQEFLARKELALRNTHLKSLHAAKDQLLQNVSHEFRTPLTLILGTFRHLQGKLEGILRANVEVGLRNGARLLLLVNELLDLARLEAGRQQPRKEPADLAQLARNAVASFSSSEAPQRVQLQFDGESLWTVLDVRAVKKVVFNLISNGLKFNHPDRARVTVRLRRKRLRRKADWVVVEVEDNGIGIPPDHLDHIFERFTQVEGDATRRFEGTGIGLALVEEVVSSHDGTVEVESEVGRGTTFRVKLPFQEPDARAAGDAPVGSETEDLDQLVRDAGLGTTTAAEPPSARTGIVFVDPGLGQDAPLVLAADDNADLRFLVHQSLGREFRVILAADGKEALALAREHLPDLVVTDQMMPEMGGTELLAELRADRTLAQVPVVFVTARSETEGRVQTLATGADDYLTKPFEEQELLVRVRNLIIRRQQERMLAELARVDGLTGVANRRSFDEMLESLWKDSARRSLPLSLLLCDIDDFKAFNDTYGHQAGDRCLAGTAAAIAAAVFRPADFVARYGGEEFAVLLPDTDRHGAAIAAERICSAVRELAIEHRRSRAAAVVTISIGGATARPTMRGPETVVEFLAQADSALYGAKEAGRNRSLLANPTRTPGPVVQTETETDQRLGVDPRW
jgi:diguanylate cyclase (GGDEF)-like protein